MGDIGFEPEGEGQDHRRQQDPLRQTRMGSSLDRRSCTPMRPLPSMDGAATMTAAHVVTDHPPAPRHAEPSTKAMNVGKRLPSTRVEWLWDRFWAWMATPEFERLWDRFWAWMATPEAGNLAEWVGAVGTTGALLLGLHLLRRDREAKVADQVSVWRSWQLRPSQDDPHTADVFAQLHIANHSLGLIILPRVYTWIVGDGEVGQEFALEDLPPYGAEVIEVPVIDPRVKLCSVLSFKDRRGKTLFKDMHTQKVIHGRKIRRRIVAIRRAKLKWLAQQYGPPAAMLADDAADQAMSAAPEYLGLSSH